MNGRLVSVDVMRGATMAVMIVVNNPGSWAHMAPELRHAAWGDWPTVADLVFPFFLLLVGVATPLALGRRLEAGENRRALWRRAAQRAAGLFLIGLFLNLFPQFDLATVRIPGVLQRIAVVSLVCATAMVWLGHRGLLTTIAALLVGYGALLTLVPVPGIGASVLQPDEHLPAWLDDRVFGGHTWRGAGDPEGILSSLGAIATGLMGVLAGRYLRGEATPRRQARRLMAVGVLTLVAGLLTSRVLPLAKEVWTPSYTLVTGGAALAVLGLLRGWLGPRDVVQSGRVEAALSLLGRQALLAYVLAHLISDVSIHVLRWSVDGGSRSWHTLVHGQLLASWLPPVWASVVYSLLVLAAVWVLVALADRRGWRLRV